MFARTSSQQPLNSANSSADMGTSTTCSAPPAPTTAGTPTKTPLSPYSPSRRVVTGRICFSSRRTTLAMRAAVEQMPYSVHCLPLNTTQPASRASLRMASRSKRKRSSVLSHSVRGLPPKDTEDQGTIWDAPCSPMT